MLTATEYLDIYDIISKLSFLHILFINYSVFQCFKRKCSYIAPINILCWCGLIGVDSDGNVSSAGEKQKTLTLTPSLTIRRVNKVSIDSYAA